MEVYQAPKTNPPTPHKVCFNDHDIKAYQKQWRLAAYRTRRWLRKLPVDTQLTEAQRFFQILLTTHQADTMTLYNQIILKEFHDLGFLEFLESPILPEPHLKKKKYLVAFKNIKGDILFTKKFSSLREIQVITGVNLNEIKISGIDYIDDGQNEWLKKSGIQLASDYLSRHGTQSEHHALYVAT
tara:strand:+ start:302 stop:853 length:552 start_codon:yes stop_codon:yes gene_type:complete